LILATGLHLLVAIGGMAAPHYARTMLLLGIIMMLIFAHVSFAPTRKLQRSVAAQDWPAGGAALAQIRKLIGINLILGLVTIAVVFVGRAIG
jgi:uncharacterized membrane protein